MYNSAVKLLDIASEKYANNVAILDNKESITYSRYRGLSLAVATAILEKSPPSNRSNEIAIFLPKSYKNIVAFMGVLYSGNAYVPIDTNMPDARLDKILQNLTPEFVITDIKHFDIIKSTGICENKILVFDDIINTPVNRHMINEKLSHVIDTDPIYIMYTSGSTGVPKGVVITHRGVLDYASWVVKTFHVDENTVMGNQAPFHFDNSVLDIYSCILTGAKLVIIPEIFFQFPIKLPEYINQKGINFIFWVPTVMINVANSGILDEVKMPKLKKVLFCGEVMPNRQLNIWRKSHPDILYANLYGPTEITDVCTYYVVDREFKDADHLPIGIPCENTNVIILTDDDTEAIVDEIGELCVIGSGLALGYFKEPLLTDKVFTANPLNTKYNQMMYRTGDLVYKNSDGLIIYVGRKDSQIKHKGNRIELGEIETIAKSLKEMQNVCVLYDNDIKEIVMFADINSDRDTKILEDTILKKMRKLIPIYMIPSRVIFLDKLPINANGKIDRVQLKTLLGREES